MEPIETIEPLIPAEPKGIILTEEAQYFLHQSGRWARFLGILGFIGTGFLLLFGLFFSAITSLIPSYQSTAGMTGAFSGFMGFFYIIIAVFYFFVSRYLYQFGDRIKSGIEFSNSGQVTDALGKLKSFFKMVGITSIVFIALYIVIIIGAIIAAVAMRGNLT